MCAKIETGSQPVTPIFRVSSQLRPAFLVLYYISLICEGAEAEIWRLHWSRGFLGAWCQLLSGRHIDVAPGPLCLRMSSEF